MIGPSTSSSPPNYHRGLHLLAIATACAVFPLIIVGAGVTSQNAGMAFPDWPTSNGHLLNPPNWLVETDKLWEHGHRLIGWVVGMLAIATAISSFRRGWMQKNNKLQKRGTRLFDRVVSMFVSTVAVLSFKRGNRLAQFAIATLLAITVQGILGGFRVWEISTPLALVHGIFGQLCFGLACTTALLSSKSWLAYDGGPHLVRGATFLQRLCLILVISVFIQLLSGATYRHMAINAAVLIHVLWVVILSLVVGWVVMWVITQHSGRTLMGKLGRILAGLMVVQLFLGGSSFLIIVLEMSKSPLLIWAVPSAHVAVGALMLVCSLSLCLCSFRVLRPAPEAAVSSSAQAAATS